MNSTFEAIRTIFNESEENATKYFTKGNQSAGTRLRKNLNDIKKLSLQLRKEISEAKNAKTV